jgi:hypothetical protein
MYSPEEAFILGLNYQNKLIFKNEIRPEILNNIKELFKGNWQTPKNAFHLGKFKSKLNNKIQLSIDEQNRLNKLCSICKEFTFTDSIISYIAVKYPNSIERYNLIKNINTLTNSLNEYINKSEYGIDEIKNIVHEYIEELTNKIN